MQTFNDIASLRAEIHRQRLAGQRIAFVPTMGNLHAGHIKLVTEGLRHADRVVSSVFVNPTQFGPGEDFDNYPRTLPRDQEQLSAAGCHYLFAPPVEEMYQRHLLGLEARSLKNGMTHHWISRAQTNRLA